MPQVSVIMPVFNCQDFVTQGIESVLNQTYQDFELIIVDDGSADDTKTIVSRIANEHPAKIMFLSHEHNKGAAAARNTAIRKSKAEILMFCDADDIQHPQRLETTLQTMLETGVDMVFHDCEMIDSNGESLHRRKGYPDDLSNENGVLHLLKRNHFWTSLVLIRKNQDLILDESLPNAEDFELFLRLVLKGYSFQIIRDPLTKYRIHVNNISNDGVLSNQSVRTVLSRLPLPDIYQMLKDRHGDLQASISVAAAYLWRDEVQEAIQLLEGKPFSIDGFFALAVSYYKLGEYKKSLNVFENMKDKVQNAAVLNNIGVLRYILYGKGEDVECYLMQALELQKDYIDAQRNLSNLGSGNIKMLKLTERPLRDQLVHTINYQVD